MPRDLTGVKVNVEKKMRKITISVCREAETRNDRRNKRCARVTLNVFDGVGRPPVA